MTRIDERKSFATETTLRTNWTDPIIEKAHQAGYDVHVTYIAAESPQIHIERVNERADRSGHSAPPAVIEDIYYKSLGNLPNLIEDTSTSKIQSLVILDGTPHNAPAIELIAIQDSRVANLAPEINPWLTKALEQTPYRVSCLDQAQQGQRPIATGVRLEAQVRSPEQVLPAQTKSQEKITRRNGPLQQAFPNVVKARIPRPNVLTMPQRPFSPVPLDANRTITSHQIIVDGVHLHYFELAPAEPSKKSPLLVLHQLLATAETLAPFLAHLPRDRRIIALDILSATPATGALDVTQASLAALISHFMQAIGLNHPVLIGHSHGGALALRLASNSPTEFPGLVLLSPAHPFGGYRSHVVNFYLTRWGRFLALSIPLAPSWMILRAYNQAAGPTTPITMQQLRPYLRILRDRDALRRVLEMLHCWEADMGQLSAALLATPLQQPVLLLWGDHDVIVPPSSSAALQQALPTSQLITLPGRGHLLPDEAAADCAAHIEQWFFDQQMP